MIDLEEDEKDNGRAFVTEISVNYLASSKVTPLDKTV